jgi:SSS family transporter
MPIGSLDLAIVAAYLLGVIALGLWLARGQKNAVDYLLGGRDLPWPALLVSIVATETSTITFLSVPGLVWGEGLAGSPGDLRFLQLPLGYVIGRVLAARFLLPLYFRGELFTAYEVLQHRFGALLRGLASGLFVVMRTLADGLRLLLTAVVLKELAGIELSTAVLAIGGSTLVYTFFGGVRAVVWTDVLQFAIYMLGAVFAAATLWSDVGPHLGDLLASPAGQSHLRAFSFEWTLTDPYTLQAGVVAGAFLSLGTHGVDQLIVQRYLCARSQRDAQKALVASGFVVLLQFAFFLGIGLLLWAFYREHPPAAPFAKGDAVFADYLVHHMPSGVRGLVLGAVFAAAMSTLSSSLNSSATALVNDVVQPLRGRSTDDPRLFGLARGATAGFGAAQIAVALGWPSDSSVIGDVLAIASFTTGILLGVFFLARLRTVVSPTAAVAALLGGAVATTSVLLLPQFDGPRIAWPWFTPIGAVAAFATGVLVNALLRQRRGTSPR